MLSSPKRPRAATATASCAPEIAEARARSQASGEEEEEDGGDGEVSSFPPSSPSSSSFPAERRSILLALGPADATRISPSAARDAALEQATQPKSDPPAQEPFLSFDVFEFLRLSFFLDLVRTRFFFSFLFPEDATTKTHRPIKRKQRSPVGAEARASSTPASEGGRLRDEGLMRRGI